MSLPKTDLEQMGVKASVLPFNPTPAIQKTNVQEAIEQAIANAALSSETYLVKEASADLSAERVVTDTSTISIDWATGGQAKFNWLGLITDLSPELGGDLDLNSSDIVGTGSIQISGNIEAVGGNVNAVNGIFTTDVTVADEAYSATDWNGSLEVPTKNAVRDKIELILGTTLPGAYQPLDGTLTALAGVTVASDKLIYATGADAFATTDLVANARTILGHTFSQIRADLDLEAGTDFYSLADLVSVANGKGSALIGIEDAGSYFSGSTIESALQALGARVASLDAAVVLRGSWAANAGTFPGSGTAQAGDSYIITTGGTVDGIEFTQGDRIIAILDNASTTVYASNWLKADYTDRVNTVAGRTGNVVIVAADLADFTETVQDVIGGIFVDSTEINWTYDDSLNTLTQNIINNSVVLGRLAQGTALSVLGVTGNAGANYADMVAGSDGHVMRRSGTAIGFGTIATAGIGDAQVTLAKMANIATNSLIGRDTTSSGVPESILLNATLEMDGSLNLQRAALTGAVAASAGSNATTATGGFAIIIEGGGSVISTGVKHDIRIPFALTLTGWTLLVDQSGAIKIDIWRDTLANFPPTNGDSITNAHEPEITASGTNAEDTNISDWSDVTMDAGDILRFNVDSAATVTRCTLVLYYTKTG